MQQVHDYTFTKHDYYSLWKWVTPWLIINRTRTRCGGIILLTVMQHHYHTTRLGGCREKEGGGGRGEGGRRKKAAYSLHVLRELTSPKHALSNTKY